MKTPGPVTGDTGPRTDGNEAEDGPSPPRTVDRISGSGLPQSQSLKAGDGIDLASHGAHSWATLSQRWCGEAGRGGGGGGEEEDGEGEQKPGGEVRAPLGQEGSAGHLVPGRKPPEGRNEVS